MPFQKREALPRVQYTKDPKKRCKQIQEAFKKLQKTFPKYPSYIKIKKSTIKGAGKGVFATCMIPKGTRLGFYKGVCTQPGSESPSSAYLMDISFGGKSYVVIDANNEKRSNWTRFVNCPEKASHANVIFRQYGKIMYYIADKNISKGDELFVWYGEDYVNQSLKQYFSGFKPSKSEYVKNKKQECKYLNR